MTSLKPESEKLSLWVQCVGTTLVALGAAYASYRHGRDFALRFGADAATAAIWPLIVDGLLTTATVELWKPSHGRRGGGRWAAWAAFGFGISLSLCANIGSAPRLTVFSIVVAACPPLALLLAVELLNRALKRHRGDGRGLLPDSVDASSEPVIRAVEVTCSSREKVRLYLRQHRDDVEGARVIAATYCLDNYDECVMNSRLSRLGEDLLLVAAGVAAAGVGRPGLPELITLRQWVNCLRAVRG